MKAVYIEQTGGPEVLRLGDRPVPEPQKDEVLVKVAVSGVNFTDLNQRSGINKIPVPAVLGSEGAGTVERSNSPSFAPGDRVAWCMVRGSYAEYAAVPGADAGPHPGKHRLPHGGGRHAPGHDRALPVALDVPAQERATPR